MYLIVNKQGKVLSKNGEWVSITQVKAIQWFEIYIQASQMMMKCGGEYITDSRNLLQKLIERLDPLGDTLHRFLMNEENLESTSEVGGIIEKNDHIKSLLNENEILQKKIQYLERDNNRLVVVKQELENIMEELDK